MRSLQLNPRSVGQTERMTEARHAKLLAAINARDAVRVADLVAEGFDLNVPCDHGASPLFAAVLSGDLTVVRCLLDGGADPNFIAQEPAASVYCERVLEVAQQ